MAYLYDVNTVNSANGGADFIFRLVTLLVSAGYVKRSDSDGTTYDAMGGQVTHAGSGANGLNNSRAWICLRGPAAMSPRREWCFQRGSGGNTAWWIKVSAEDMFVGGAPDNDDMPTATDEFNLHGTTTAGTTLFTTAATYHQYMACDNVTPYAWYGFDLINGTAVQDMALVFEPLVSGSYPVEDDDPALYYARQGTPFSASTIGNSAQGPFGWFQKDGVGDTTARYPACTFNEGNGASQAFPGVGVNPENGKDDTAPIAYIRRSGLLTQVGVKGFAGTLMRWVGTTRANADTLSVSLSKDRIYVGSLALPWDGSSPVF